MRFYVDHDNHFTEIFNQDTGVYIRSDQMDANGKSLHRDPFMRNFPSLIDIGIMGHCVCAEKCNVDCYQRAIDRKGGNMALSDYLNIMRQCDGRVFEVALGGAGDPDTHENFEDIMRITRGFNVVPNFTTSGIAFNQRKAEICKEMAGAVAVSEHNADYTREAVNLLLRNGVKTNIHYVLSSESIEQAVDRLNSGYYNDVNAVVFLLYKPVGLGRHGKMLWVGDPRLKTFFEAVENHKYTHKVGFDSCMAPAIVNFAKTIDMDSVDFCEAARFSMYIDAQMNAMPCSFANQNTDWHINLRDKTIEDAWCSDLFEKFRFSLKYSCPDCTDYCHCAGGCPLMEEIVLCDRPEMKLR